MEKCGDKQRERRRRREKGEIDRKERKRDRNEKQENCVLNKKSFCRRDSQEEFFGIILLKNV